MSSSIPPLPVELVRHVASYCSQSTLKSLVLLGRRFYDSNASILYRSVLLTSVENTSAFCNTMVTGNALLRSYVCILDIQLRFRYLDRIDGPLGESIKGALSFTHNLEHLVLDLPPGVLGPILDFEHFPYSFSLRTLRLPVLPNIQFTRFIAHHVYLEELDLANCRTNRPTVPDYWLEGLYEPNVLPNLRHLVIQWTQGCELIKGRPVSSIHICSVMRIEEVTAMKKLIRLSTVLLVALQLGLSVYGNESEFEVLVRLLSELADTRCTLKELGVTVWLYRSRRPTQADKTVLSIDQDDLQRRLSGFSALQSFQLEVNEWQTKEGALSHLRLVDVLSPLPTHIWRQACPNLKRISIVGTEVLLGSS